METQSFFDVPLVDHSLSYSKYERLTLALSQYYAELRLYNQNADAAGGSASATDAITHPKPVVTRIAKLYDVAETSLRRHIRNPNQRTLEEMHNDCQVLTVAEEETLVKRLLFLDDFNVPASRTLFYSLAQNLLNRRDPTRTLGKNWIYRFLGRSNQECRYVLTKTIAANRANAYSWDVMDDFFWKLKIVTDKYSIAPRNTYNLDEKGFLMGVGDTTKRICRNIRGNPVYKEHRNRESCSVVESIAPDGFSVTPLIIFMGKNHLAGWYRERKEMGFWFGYSDKGYNNSQLCIEYVKNIFEPETAARAFGEWRLLIFDGFESHLNLELIDFCLDHKIIPFCLPAHTSHVLQPLDVGVFSAVQKYYRQEINEVHVPIGKENFPNIFARARNKAFSKNNIASGFRATGIWPFNPAAILDKLYLPEPTLPSSLERLPPPENPNHQSAFELLSYRPKTPTTPRSIHTLYVEALATINSSSPRSVKQRALFTKLKTGAEKCAAQVVMHEIGEEHLRNEIKELASKSKPDKRRLNTSSACVLERGEVLLELKRKRDEADERVNSKKAVATAKKAKKSSAGSLVNSRA